MVVIKVKFAICADLHCDYIHDSFSRFDAFIKEAKQNEVDFCVQLGDFCPPGNSNAKQKNQILTAINKSDIPFYHSLGNHDMDKNLKTAVLAHYGIESSYYSFDIGNFHFIALDSCNCVLGGKTEDYNLGNYKQADSKYIAVLSEKELDWLKTDLENAKYPSVLFSHHSLTESRASIGNVDEFRRAIKHAKNGVIAAFCGHEHVDRAEFKDGIWYCCINSMSYYWAGSKYEHETYGEKIEKDNPLVRKVFPYRDPLFATVEIDDKAITITGRNSEFVGSSPNELEFTKPGLCDPIVPRIENKTLILE
ncbi:MAG: metallophosphoesterase [Clostridia bacterium]|nr:metallophosphoesterase [Clostridia bacterium]